MNTWCKSLIQINACIPTLERLDPWESHVLLDDEDLEMVDKTDDFFNEAKNVHEYM